MRIQNPKTKSLVRRLCGAALAANAFGVPAVVAQQADAAPAVEGEPIQMEKIVVTGSLLPTAETVGPAPMDTLTTESIQQVGSSDVLAALKKLTPVMSGNNNLGQEVNNGGFGEANVAIRNLPTLVMLNGRRLGNSSFSNGQLVDLNTIPLAAIERIEVLKDGASAIYGSEAIGGVVNIITKQNYSGVEVGGRYGFATGEGHTAEFGASIVAGTGNEKSSFMAAAQYYHRDPLLTTDRELAWLDIQELYARNVAFTPYLSPSFPGKVQDSTGAYLLRSSPLLIGTPDYNPNILTPPVLPGQTFVGPTAVQDYNNAALAATGVAPYVQIPGDLYLNTPVFGTYSLQKQDRQNFFASGDHELFEERMIVFGEFLFANIESEGVLAPSPVISLGRQQGNINIPANNPYNPFGVALGPEAGVVSNPRIRSRFVDSGNRLFQSLTDYYHFVGGLRGELHEDLDYEAAYTYNRYDQTQFTKNAVNGAALDQALIPNTNPAYAGLSQLYGPNGFVPIYNFFSTGGQNSPDTLNAMRTTLFQSGKSEEWNVTGILRSTPVEVPAGELGVAVGFGYGSEFLGIDFDGLTRAGKVPGLNPNLPTEGRRDNWAVFAEAQIPLTSPEMEIPVLHRTEVTVAVRHESFDPGGEATVPKLGLRWQPLDEQFTLRGNYSHSFLAPTTYDLFGGTAVNVPVIGLPDGVFQEYTTEPSNAGLVPAKSENWGAGIVISPKAVKGLTVSVDYYNIKVEDYIFRVGSQAMVDDLNANGSNSRWVNNYRDINGNPLTSTAADQVLDSTWGSLSVPLLNGAELDTDGIDVGAQYEINAHNAGIFTVFGSANILLNFEYADPIVGGPYPYHGMYTDEGNGVAGAQGTLPDYLITGGVNWELPCGPNAFGLTVNFRYVPEVEDPYSLHPSFGNYGWNDFTLDGTSWTVDSYFQVDLQLAYELGKNSDDKDWYDGTRFVIGVNNVADAEPPHIASSFEDNTDKSTYDILGRFLYFEVSKKF
jgi:iron complex outermembrane receptor protein